MSWPHDPELPAGFQDADIEMRELQAHSDETERELREAGRLPTPPASRLLNDPPEPDDPPSPYTFGGPDRRYAIVKKTVYASTKEIVEKYLPDNYRVIGEEQDEFLVAGVDVAGWTLEEYVLPRLASALIVAREIKEGP